MNAKRLFEILQPIADVAEEPIVKGRKNIIIACSIPEDMLLPLHWQPVYEQTHIMPGYKRIRYVGII